MIIKQLLPTIVNGLGCYERAPWTHPGYATLADPLFAFGGKRVEKLKKKLTLFTACGREGGRAKQRPGELSPQKPSIA